MTVRLWRNGAGRWRARGLVALTAAALGCAGEVLSTGSAPSDATTAPATDAEATTDAEAAPGEGGAAADAGPPPTPDVDAGLPPNPADCTRFVDGTLPTSACDAYHAELRACGGGTAAAHRTITDALSAARPGDITCVRAGDYAERVEVAVSGSATDGPITLRAYPSEACRPGTGLRKRDCGVRVVGDDGRIVIRADHVTVEGLEIVGGHGGFVVEIRDANHVTLRNCRLDGNFSVDGSGRQATGVCNGLDVRGASSYVTIEENEILNIADDGMGLYGHDHLLIRRNEVHALHGCGTDSGCGPCFNGHSDGIEGWALHDSVFDGNFVYDVNNTAPLIYGWVGEVETSTNLTFINNVFYAPETGFAAYLEGVDGIRLYHNVIWGMRQGAYGGLALGRELTNLEMFNNVILSINYAHMGASYDGAEHRGDYNLFGASTGQYVEQAHDLVADPGFVGAPLSAEPADFVDYPSASPEDFRLDPGSPAVDSGASATDAVPLPPHDFFGAARDGAPDRGAIER